MTTVNEKHKMLMKYLVKKLESFGCPDSFLEPTADRMARHILKLLEAKLE